MSEEEIEITLGSPLKEIWEKVTQLNNDLAAERKRTDELRAVVKELIPIAEHAVRSLIFKPDIHEQYDESIDKAKNLLR